MLRFFITAFITCCFFTTSTCQTTFSHYELELLQRIPGYNFIENLIETEAQESTKQDEQVYQDDAESNILFKQYPGLRHKLSYIALSDLPTPVISCHQLNTLFPQTHMYIKHDGIAGKLDNMGRRKLGANKIRKLSYLLADAKAHGHDTILTFGCAGSNHAIQTAAYAKELGLDCICMLKPQPNAHIVRRNLLLQRAFSSELHYALDDQARALATLNLCRDYKKNGLQLPYIIPTGGSIALGAIGYVEAVFELKEQINHGILPEPDHIYVTLGSGGTAAGILLGCKVAGIKAKIHLVLNEPEELKHEAWEKLRSLYTATNKLLYELDANFPLLELHEFDCTIIDTHTGTEYGLFTEETVAAIELLKNTEHIELDGVYTGKCFAGLFADLKSGNLTGNVLFWNTFCAEKFEHLTVDVDYHSLPEELHTYFTEAVQPLDR